MQTPIKNIDDVLIKMKDMQTTDDEYEFYWEAVIDQYKGLIKRLIGMRENHDDYYQECVMKLPQVISSWEPTKGKFSTHLTWRLRGWIQQLNSSDTIVKFNNTSHKYQAKKNGKEAKTVTMIPVEIHTEFGNEKGDNLFPKTYQTVIEDINYIQCMEIIKDIEGVELWKKYYLDDLSVSELSRRTGIPKFKIDKQIKAAHKTIVARLKGKV